MPRYLNTRGYSVLAIGTCDRCKTKLPYNKLGPDGNTPGLRVCEDCRDEEDPYRMPARKAENISLRFPRPDSEIVVGSDATDIYVLQGPVLFTALATEDGRALTVSQ